MEYTVKQISHTLKFGKFLSTRFFVLFFSMFGGLLFVILGALLYCVISRQDMTTIRGLCILIFIPVTILIVTAVVFIIQKRRKHIVAHWLTDEGMLVRHAVPFIVSEIGFRVAVRENKKSNKYFTAVKESKLTPAPKWMEFDAEKLEGKIVSIPVREEIDTPIQEQMIVELYSK